MTLTASDFISPDTPQSDKDSLNLALTYLSASPKGVEILQQAADNGIRININHDSDSSYDSETKTINWNPRFAITVNALITTDGVVDTPTVGIRSAAIVLLHEAAHETDPDLKVHTETPDPLYGDAAEKYAATQENIVASNLGEVQRLDHDGNPVNEVNPTEHTFTSNEGSVWLQLEFDGTTTAQGIYQPGTYSRFAPTNNDGGRGTLTIDGPGITVNPGPNRAVDIDATGVRVTENRASINLAPGASATIIGTSDHVTAGSGASLSLTGDNNTLVLTASRFISGCGSPAWAQAPAQAPVVSTIDEVWKKSQSLRPQLSRRCGQELRGALHQRAGTDFLRDLGLEV
jgi:hypothetical protein